MKTSYIPDEDPLKAVGIHHVVTMHEFVWFGQQLISASSASLPAFSLAAFYGKGIFTTVAVFDGRPFRFEKHWARLHSNALRLGLDMQAISEAEIKFALETVLRKNGVSSGRCRITILDGSQGELWKAAGGETGSILLIGTAPFRPAPDAIRITTSPFAVNSCSPLAGVKSCNYLEPIISLDDAKQRGFDEAVRVNERGHITSACMANIFWSAAGELFTPSLGTGCLAGTTRDFVLEALNVRSVESGIDAIKTADAIFLTSTGIGVTRVAELDGRKLDARQHEIELILPPKA